MNSNEIIAKVQEAIENIRVNTTATANRTDEFGFREVSLCFSIEALVGIPEYEVRGPVNRFIWSVVDRKFCEMAPSLPNRAGEDAPTWDELIVHAREAERKCEAEILRIVKAEIEAAS